MTLSEELVWRGFVNQTTLNDIKQLDSGKWVFYHGYDASTDSLTIGNLAAIMLDRCFLRHIHKGVALAGGATSLIGDPGGKDKERPLQSEETVESNVASVSKQVKHLLNIDMANNLSWFKEMNVLHFLRDVGKHFSMTPLVQRDYIAARMGEGGSGISYTEFSYTLLQGYDFLHLHEKHGVNLQLAGSDQWGNCLSGVELVRRVKGAEVHALTMPLIINEVTGVKFGKSEEGAVWLDPAKTSPTQFYQFWINTDDSGVESYLKIFTELYPEDIVDIMERHNKDPRQREAQRRLAEEVTAIVHGKDETKKAQAVTDVLTGRTDIWSISHTAITTMRKELPSIKVKDGASTVKVLVKTGLASSNTEARRLLSENGIYINNQAIPKETLDENDFREGRLLLRRGKALKDSALVELE